MKVRNYKEFSRLLMDNNFKFERVHGSHEVWKRNGDTIVVPFHNVNFMIQKRLIKSFNLKEEK